MKNTTELYNTPYQLKLPLEISKIIEISDPVYTFSEVFHHIDLNKCLAVKECRIGRKRYDEEALLKVILFAFMTYGYQSTREIEQLCKTDIRFMWLLQDNEAPSHMTIDNFMRESLSDNIDDILSEINAYIFEQKHVDLAHIYIDGTKIKANANKYSWVWKKSSIKNRQKVFNKITALLEEINAIAVYQGVTFELRSEYAIEYMEEVISQYIQLTGFNPETAAYGKGHHKTAEQKNYEKLVEYTERLKKYAKHINICGENRNSYSKTDNDATFMRMKRDYMGNDQLLPGLPTKRHNKTEKFSTSKVQNLAPLFVALENNFFKPNIHHVLKNTGSHLSVNSCVSILAVFYSPVFYSLNASINYAFNFLLRLNYFIVKHS